jgi:hypothetical protein
METCKTTVRIGSLPEGRVTEERKQLSNLRGIRYVEVFLIAPFDGTLKAAIYNTTTFSDAWSACSAHSVEALTRLKVEAIKHQFDVHGVSINGPRQWTLDWIDAPFGTLRDGNGLKAAWVAMTPDPETISLHDMAGPYHPMTVERKTEFGFRKGRPVFILDDPNGNSWVMKSFSLLPDAAQTVASLDTLGEKLKLAPGWSFRVEVLDRDLILLPENGIARSVQDDLGNTYELTGKGYSNFQP